MLAPAGPAGSELLGVSCPRPDGCTAVGDLFTASGRHTFAEAWTGTRWRILPAADTHSPDSELAGVFCHSASRCLAVGLRSRQTPAGLLTLTLAEIWDGLRWRVLPTPSPGTVLTVLAGVSCGAAVSCVAVGGYLDRGQPLEKPLAETWNGTRWRTTPVPGQGTGGSLLGISCPAARCVAIGAEATTTRSGPVADEWDGTRWHRLPGPEPAAAHDNLVSISCPRAGRCVAVGDSFRHAGTARALAEEWNGRQWHLINRTQHDPARARDRQPRATRTDGLAAISPMSRRSWLADIRPGSLTPGMAAAMPPAAASVPERRPTTWRPRPRCRWPSAGRYVLPSACARRQGG